MRISICAMIAFASVAGAEVPPANGLVATFDVIFNVPEVQSLAFDPATGSLYAAMSPIGDTGGASTIVRWRLDPIRLSAKWPTGTMVSDLAVSPSGLVYAAGQSGASPGQASIKSFPARNGSVINLDPDRPELPPFGIISFSLDGINAISRFNQLAFDNDDTVFITSPTRFSVTVVADSQKPSPKGQKLAQLVLTCGAPAQLSLLQADERTGYVTSTTDGALLEIGVVNPTADAYGKPSVNCFRVANVFGYAEAPSTLNSVMHAVLTDAAGRPDAILALEPNTGTLHLLRLDIRTQQLARADRIELAVKGEAYVAGAMNILTASDDGSVIFVSGKDRDIVLRFRRDADRLQATGMLVVGSGLRSIRIGADGLHAALVVRDDARLDRIHVIRNPGNLGDGWQKLPSSGSTLRKVQSDLIKLGFAFGPADGMLGPQTLAAIGRFLDSETLAESPAKEIQLAIEGILLTR